MKRKLWSAFAVLCMVAPVCAFAAEGYVVDNVNLRAGPDPTYPLVDQLEGGTRVDVQGCTPGWEWCDVINENDGSRGWIAGNYIQYDYQDQPVLLSDYGAQIGIPIVAFSIGTYWDRYYRSRPFYGDRGNWYNRPYVRRPPPPPPRGSYPGGRPGNPGGGGAPWRGPNNGNNGGQSRPGYPGDQRPGHLGPIGPTYPARTIPQQSVERMIRPDQGQLQGRPPTAQGQLQERLPTAQGQLQGRLPTAQGQLQGRPPTMQGQPQARPQTTPAKPAVRGDAQRRDGDRRDDNGH
jgi:uncharacterized protein YraI